MSENNFDFALALGGEAGQGIANPVVGIRPTT